MKPQTSGHSLTGDTELGSKYFFKGILTIPSLIIMLHPNYKALRRHQGVW